MARIVKSAAVRQDELLDIAERLFLQHGYDSTPIQAILDAAGIAKGTFYHHYPSKSDLLDAVVRRWVDRSLVVVGGIVADPTLDAIAKMNAFFLRTSAWKTQQRAIIMALHRALQDEGNAALNVRLERDSFAAVRPYLASIISQGIDEGVFHTPWPGQAARMMLELGAALGRYVGAALLASRTPSRAELDEHLDAYTDAAARLLGAEPGRLQLFDRAVLDLWFSPGSTS